MTVGAVQATGSAAWHEARGKARRNQDQQRRAFWQDSEGEISMEIATNLSNEIACYLDLATDEAKLTAVNMANVDTPGYQTVGMDFEGEMRQAIDEVEQGRAPHKVHVTKVDGLIARPDGNNVSIDRESLNLAQAQLKFRAGVALLRDEYQDVLDAIHAK